jgi:NAD(P)-dependent dehydrogenase (short-subunit alcohol dehydrogenase family)
MQPPAQRLAGKVAIVTGGGSRAAGIGTGRAAAVLFARHGARVLVVDRDLPAARDTVGMIDEDGGEAVAFQADVTSADSCAEMVREAVGRWGRLDILDNNLGIEGPGTILDVDESGWDKVFDVNVRSVILASRAAVPAMAETGGGAIVNLASISAFHPAVDHQLSVRARRSPVRPTPGMSGRHPRGTAREHPADLSARAGSPWRRRHRHRTRRPPRGDPATSIQCGPELEQG